MITYRRTFIFKTLDDWLNVVICAIDDIIGFCVFRIKDIIKFIVCCFHIMCICLQILCILQRTILIHKFILVLFSNIFIMPLFIRVCGAWVSVVFFGGG